MLATCTSPLRNPPHVSTRISAPFFSRSPSLRLALSLSVSLVANRCRKVRFEYIVLPREAAIRPFANVLAGRRPMAAQHCQGARIHLHSALAKVSSGISSLPVGSAKSPPAADDTHSVRCRDQGPLDHKSRATLLCANAQWSCPSCSPQMLSRGWPLQIRPHPQP